MTDPDKRAFELMLQHGDRASIPRPVTIWLYGERHELADVRQEVAAAGWFVAAFEPCDGTWMLRAERELEASDAALDAALGEVRALVAFTDVLFDGWETIVERGQ